jgi:hypothetical protein
VRKKLELLQHQQPQALPSTPTRSQSVLGAAFSKANPLKKKEKEPPAWLKLTSLTGHRDGIWDICNCRWEKSYFATASLGIRF